MVTKEKLMDLETDVIKKAGTFLAVIFAGIILVIGLTAGNSTCPQSGGGGGGGYPMIGPGVHRTMENTNDEQYHGMRANSDRMDNIHYSDSQTHYTPDNYRP